MAGSSRSRVSDDPSEWTKKFVLEVQAQDYIDAGDAGGESDPGQAAAVPESIIPDAGDRRPRNRYSW